MKRLGAAIELVMTDRATDPNEDLTLPGAVQDIGVKVYDAVSEIIPVALSIFSQKEYVVVPRNGITSSTRAAVGNTMRAQWFNKGNPLNLGAKAAVGFTELFPDALIRDGLHMGRGGRNGTVIQTAA